MNAAFIGLGAMGLPMARNMHAAGLLSVVHSRTLSKAEALAAEFGIESADSAVACLAHADVLFLCVTADEQVLELVDALAVPEARGKLIVDTSTVAASTAKRAAEKLAAVGARFVDAPVTGGTEGAIKGSLTFIVGGAEPDVQRAQAGFDAMGGRSVHMGDVGAGQATKAVNQVMCAGINQAVTEGLAFAEAQGLPLDKVIAVTRSGAAGSWFVEHRGASMVRGEFPLGFKLALHLKDLKIVQAMAAENGGRLPVVDQTVSQYEALMAAGHGDEDISALYRSNKRLFNGN